MENVNILIVTHGVAGKALMESCKMIVGEAENLDSISLDIGMSPEDLILVMSNKLESYQGHTLVLTDLFGGTPSNVSTMLSNKYDMKCVSGVNLPMLLQAVTTREGANCSNLEKYVEEVVEAGSTACMKFGLKRGEM